MVRIWRFSVLGLMILLLASCVSGPATDQNADLEATHDSIAKLIEKTAPQSAETIAEPKAQVVVGSGRFVGAVSESSGAGRSANDLVSIDLEDASIDAAAQTLLGDILGANFIVEEGVQGMITLRTAEPVERSAVLSIFEGALSSRGAVLIYEDGIYRIAPLEFAAAGPQQFSVGSDTPAMSIGYGVQVVPLKYISAAEMERILEPIAASGSILRVDSTRNLLMLGGPRREVSALLEAIRIFDVDWLKGMSFALLPVKSADPEELAAELTTIFANADSDPLKGVVRFVPNGRLNALLVISTQPAYLQKARQWLERLDNPKAAGGDQLFVYNVQNRPARELEEVLNAFLGGSRSGSYDDNGLQPGLTQEVIGGGADAAERIGGLARAGGSVSLRDQSVRIVADDANNALVVYASPYEYERLASMIKQLDVLPNQVLIEATIAEVRLRDELEYGLRWFFDNGDHSFTFTDVASGAVAQSFPGFSYLFSGNDARVTLNALSGITDVKVVSSPTLMVLDNRTARLQIGDQVPVATQSAVNVDNPDAPIVNSVSFRDTGVILSITPRVNDSGVIILDIEQEVSSVISTTSSGIDSPTIQQRRIETSVAVHNGDSLTLGGLIEDGTTITSTGVPVLDKIPVLGEVFKSKNTADERTELLILITPRIVRDRFEAQEVTDEFRSRLENLRPVLQRVEE